MAARSISGSIAPAGGALSAVSNPRTFMKVSTYDTRLSHKAKCQTCKGEFSMNRVRTMAGNDVVVTDKFCTNCWKKKRSEFRNRKGQNGSFDMETGAFSQMFGLAVSEDTSPTWALPVTAAGVDHTRAEQTIVFPNYMFDGTTGWKQAASMPDPIVMLRVSTDASDYRHLRLGHPNMSPTTLSIVADTGAQSCLMGEKCLIDRSGLSTSGLEQVKQRKHAINVLGALFLRLSGANTSTGRKATTAAMVHVTETTDLFYLSRKAMNYLGIINANFPVICFRWNRGTTDIWSCPLWLPRSPPPTVPPWETPFCSGNEKYPEDEKLTSQNIRGVCIQKMPSPATATHVWRYD